jgi:hypothetical protein
VSDPVFIFNYGWYISCGHLSDFFIDQKRQKNKVNSKINTTKNLVGEIERSYSLYDIELSDSTEHPTDLSVPLGMLPWKKAQVVVEDCCSQFLIIFIKLNQRVTKR